jgi:Protein of unknown function (DUF3309)
MSLDALFLIVLIVILRRVIPGVAARLAGWGYGPSVGALSIIVVILSCCGAISSSGACPASCTCLPTLFQKTRSWP